MILLFLIIILIILIKNNNSEEFVSDKIVKKIKNNKEVFNPNNPVKNIKKKICEDVYDNNCIDIVDVYKITNMYNKNPNSINYRNINKVLNKI